MKANDCSGLPAMERCDAELPDSPQCAPNYHFGMLLGVADFRAEQGFHVGKLRRHQRLLHGSGVVVGYDVSYKPADQELRVGTGLAVDALGRDLVLEVPQCVSLPLWWLAHRDEDAFADIATPDDATLDLDVVVCYSCCLGNPVPAIAEPCAGSAADIAYSRICETVQLRLVRTPAVPVPEPPLALEVPDFDDEDDELTVCLTLARLRGLRLKLEPDGWKVTLGTPDMGVRKILLSTQRLQQLLLAEPVPQPALAGPVVVPGGATLAGSTVTLVFSQALAPLSIASAFLASEFDAVLGWRPFTPAPPVYDGTDPASPKVTLTLDRAPAGQRVRITVAGTGNTPLLGATLVPAGAATPAGEGRDLSTTILRS